MAMPYKRAPGGTVPTSELEDPELAMHNKFIPMYSGTNVKISTIV